jgi:hypothetical protein
MTMAMKAQKVLSREAIRASVVKVSRSTSGCVYGIEFDAVLLGNVRAALANTGIEVKEYLR